MNRSTSHNRYDHVGRSATLAVLAAGLGLGLASCSGETTCQTTHSSQPASSCMAGGIEGMRAAKNDFLKFCKSLRIDK